MAFPFFNYLYFIGTFVINFEKIIKFLEKYLDVFLKNYLNILKLIQRFRLFYLVGLLELTLYDVLKHYYQTN